MASEIKEENNSTSSDVKDEEKLDETKKVDGEEKDGDKDSVKSETKDESGKEASEDEEDDDDDDDDEVALLDRPVEVTGCRARKKVERLEVSFATPKEKQEVPEGKGKKLGDCPRIEVQIQKMKPIDLKPMHKILFNRAGSANEIKKNIRKFSGFPFDKSSSEYLRKKNSVEKLTASVLKQVCLILDIERGGTKEEIVNRIMSFLLNPEDSGKKVQAPKKKVSKEKKKSSGKKVKSEKKGKSSKDESDDDEEAEDSIEDGDESMGGTDEEAEGTLTELKKKSKKSKSKGEKGKKENEKKQKGIKRKHDDDDDDDDDDDEDDDSENSSGDSSGDEPVAKKSKMPSDEDISKLVKQILESADLQEITMKKVIKQVSDAYPDFDLSNKKAFIKSTIKSIL